MKKITAMILVLTLCLAMLAGCGKSTEPSAVPAAPESVVSVEEPVATLSPVEAPEAPEAPEAEPASAEEPEADSAVEEEPAIGMPNPMTEVKADELDIPLTAPKDATDVRYFTLEDEKGEICQMDFTLEDIEYCYRAQPSGEKYAYDISGMYYTGWTAVPAKVQNCDGTVMTCDEASVIYWLDAVPGINYTLATANPIPADDITKLADEIFVSAQGDVDGDEADEKEDKDAEDKDAEDKDSEDKASEKADEETDDDTVVYTDKDENTVKLIDEGNGIYSVGVSIIRLSHVRGTAFPMDDGGYEIVVLDPNGEELKGYFMEDDDDTYTLKIVSSDWDLLEEGTTFSGFTTGSKANSKADSKADTKTDSKADAEDEIKAEDE